MTNYLTIEQYHLIKDLGFNPDDMDTDEIHEVLSIAQRAPIESEVPDNYAIYY